MVLGAWCVVLGAWCLVLGAWLPVCLAASQVLLVAAADAQRVRFPAASLFPTAERRATLTHRGPQVGPFSADDAI
ncbi:MAG: hypothetical protein KDA72_21330 [Planctomycetales bacterium]|nr:hypothetical protein [Planctomycetales bacterium]